MATFIAKREPVLVKVCVHLRKYRENGCASFEYGALRSSKPFVNPAVVRLEIVSDRMQSAFVFERKPVSAHACGIWRSGRVPLSNKPVRTVRVYICVLHGDERRRSATSRN